MFNDDSMSKHASKCRQFAAPATNADSQADDREASNHRMLYVLGFGIVGAVFANALVFAFFAVPAMSG
jgi:hypothetical protein